MKILITNKWVKVLVSLMFFFLISLVFVLSLPLPKLHAFDGQSYKEGVKYIRQYNNGQRMAKIDYRNKQLWKNYKETFPQSFRDGYLDLAVYLAMPLRNKVRYELRQNGWID